MTKTHPPTLAGETEILTRLGPYIIFQRQVAPGIEKIRLAKHQDSDTIYACKRVVKWTLSKLGFDNLNRGIEIHSNLSALSHKGVVRVVATLEDAECSYTIMERMEGDLITLLEKKPKGLPESEARSIFKQALETLQFVHANGVTHRDIKLDNFLWSRQGGNNELRVALTDFELADVISNRMFDTPCGSPSYLAPEVCCSNPEYRGPPVDVWSSGVMLYALLCGRFPWQSNDMLDLVNSIAHDPVYLPDSLSPAVSDLIRRILTKDPRERITVDQILLHPWLTSPNENGSSPSN